MFNFFCTLHGVMYELETFKNVREVWTPFSCFSLLFFLKNWRVHSVTVTILLARRTCVFFFFAFFRRAKASVMGEGREKTTPAKQALLFCLFQASTKRAWRARHARAPRRRLCARLINANTQRLFCRLPFPY